jgi:rhodanese-related sulfurtransferase
LFRVNGRYGSIGGEELYRRLAMGEPIVVLDVRTHAEYEQAHIPGSLLVPLHELEHQWSRLPNGGTPIAVICQQGYRSTSACHFLAERGFQPLFTLDGGLESWPGPLSNGAKINAHPHNLIAPSRYLVESFDLLPRGVALDVAMGNGRNAVFLATRGFDVDGVDVNPEVVEQARTRARQLGAPIRAVVGNVEDGSYIVPVESYDVVVVFNFLHRPLFNDIRDGLKPGGVVVYQTFTTEQPRFGPPLNPAHLLRPGELREAFAGFDVLRHREEIEAGDADTPPKALAGIVARKP